MTSWLGRQRKAELENLAGVAGLKDIEGLRKEELVSVLDEHLKNNFTKLASFPALKDFYDRASPVKRAGVTPSDGEVKAKRKRAPKIKEEPEASDSASMSSPVALATPAPARSSITVHSKTPITTANHVSTFPPSPAVVTDVIEAQTRKFSASVDQALVASNVKSVIHDLRELFSSVVGIETVVILLEGFYLQRQLVPWRRAFDFPAVDAVGTQQRPIYLPDFFIVLTDVYWSTTILWSLISFWIPLAASWMFNLTMRPVLRHGVTIQKPKWRCDPFTFNTVKALLAWLVFSQQTRFLETFSDATVLTVMHSLPGGFSGIIISSAIGVLASLYDAAQRK